jgi:ATP-dependent phosphoenolpyruvate carboxykinase
VAHRALIGDDEHGWNDEGVFNFEGGCYAKTIDLKESSEPEIFRAIRKDALLENIAFDAEGAPAYSDTTKTQNGRVSYPITHIPGHHVAQTAGHPEAVIFLTCDAFGVLPPVSRLDSDQAMYHFLSGYTAKVAGTERGISKPTATFSACFGEAFLTLHPTRYAELLKAKLGKHGSKVYLVNTGWSGGGVGVGKRMPIAVTRACVDAILDGSIAKSKFVKDKVFGFDVPTSLTGVDANMLQPRSSWADKPAYDDALADLGRMYAINFERYAGVGDVDYSKFGPNVDLTPEQREKLGKLVQAEK